MPPRNVDSVELPEVIGSITAIGCAWVRTHARADRVVVAVGGELDVSGSTALVGTLISLLDSGEPRALTVDLSELTFIDASGIRALLQIETDARARGCEVLLTNPHPTVARLFEICGLAQHLEPGDERDLIACNATSSTRSGDE